MKLTQKADSAFRKHVLEAYPNEASGIVVGGKYIPNTYVTNDPQDQFQIDPTLLVKHQGKIQAILHSHCYELSKQHEYNPAWPSVEDQLNWHQGNVPWGIVATEGETVSDYVWMDDSEIQPLVEREYVNGIADCFALVRDYYRLQGHDIKNMPRAMGWWQTKTDPKTGVVTPPQNLLGANWQAWGFVEIPAKEATVGDAVLIQLRSDVINHSGVITGENEFTHHFYGALSRKDDLHRWARFVVKYLRYQP